jgi:uncharacterized Zn finger protein
MSRWNYGGRDWYPRRERKAPPAHGIKVTKIGSTWWGRLWIEALERMSRHYASRLGRGRTYARNGRVHDLEVAAGRVRAKVTGTRLYRVTMSIAPLPDAVWARAVAAMAREAVFSARLLSGDMPERVDEAFAAAGATLFPTSEQDLATECSCPDWANPCKHVAAVHYVLGEAFDGDPFLLFELRGRAKPAVLEALRRERAGTAVASRSSRGATAPVARADVTEPVVLARGTEKDYEGLRAPLPGLDLRMTPPAVSSAAIRALGPPPRWALSEAFADLVAPACAAASALARRIAEPESGEDPPAR